MRRVLPIHIVYALCFLMCLFGGAQSLGKIFKQYSTVIDSSKHTTSINTYCFELQSGHNESHTQVYSYFNKTIPIGINTYRTDRRRYVAIIRSLINQTRIRSKYHKVSPITFMATDIVDMPEPDLRKLLEEMHEVFYSLKYRLYWDSVTTMSGKRKFFSYLAVNELLDRFSFNSSTAAVLDLSGKYSHVAVAVEDASTLTTWYQEYVKNWLILNTIYHIFGQSITDLGLNEARRQILEANKTTSLRRYTSPCVHPSIRTYWVLHNRTYGIIGARGRLFQQTVDVNACIRIIKKVLDNYNTSLSLYKQEVYAISEFYNAVNEPNVFRGQTVITLGALKAKYQRVCDIKDIKRPFICMDFIYVSLLLSEIYGLHNASEIHFVDEIQNVKTAWNFGVAFEMYQRDIKMIP